MCIYSQTTYSCKHNIETLTEPCDLGTAFKPSMHDKTIIGIHESQDKCEACGGPSVLIDLTQDMNNPIDLTNDDYNHIDLTNDSYTHIDLTQDPDMPPYHDFAHQDTRADPHFSSNKRVRRDSAFDGSPVMPQPDLPVDSQPAPMDTSA